MQSSTHPYSVFTIHDNAKTLKCRVATPELAAEFGEGFLNDPDVEEVWITSSLSQWISRLRPGEIPSVFYTNVPNGSHASPDEPTGSPEAKVLSHATETDDGVHWAIRRLEEKRDTLINDLLDKNLSELMRSNVVERATRQTHYLTALRWMLAEIPDSAIDCGE